MSVKKVSTGWAIDARVWHEGKELRKRELLAGGTKRTALDRELAIKADLRSANAPSSAITVADVITMYSADHDTGASKSLFETLERELGACRVSDLRLRYDAWWSRVRSANSARTGRPISNATLNRYTAWLSAAIEYAIKCGRATENPIRHHIRLKETPRDASLTHEQRLKLMAVIDRRAPHIRPIVEYMMAVPCRVDELRKVRREDVNLFSNYIRVRSGTTKTDHGVDKPIPPGMLEYFRSIPAESDFAFYREEAGRYVSIGDFKRAWNSACVDADLPGLRVHDLRHIAATDLVNNGTPEQVVMQVAGWKTNMLRTYYHRSGTTALGLINWGTTVHKPDTCVKLEIAKAL
jgi:integrase